MSKINMKRIEYDLRTEMLVVDDGQDLRFEVSRSDTDIDEGESIEDFIIRHGGLTETIASLSKV
ncbi:MAG: hypothetical protein PHO76_12990 [Methylotenera sp.]|nr:hypothetical protein [Methylotenera sp.]MDD4926154.1 hypothetical protein [Methylotenera sp.]